MTPQAHLTAVRNLRPCGKPECSICLPVPLSERRRDSFAEWLVGAAIFALFGIAVWLLLLANTPRPT